MCPITVEYQSMQRSQDIGEAVMYSLSDMFTYAAHITSTDKSVNTVHTC
jgi:hypothetical protein